MSHVAGIMTGMAEIHTPTGQDADHGGAGERRQFEVSASGRPVRPVPAVSMSAVCQDSRNANLNVARRDLSIEVVLFPVKVALRVVTWICVVYLMSYGMAAATVDLGQGSLLWHSAGEMLHAPPVMVRDFLASVLSPRVPPMEPAMWAATGVAAFVARRGLEGIHRVPREQLPSQVAVALRSAPPPPGESHKTIASRSGEGAGTGARERRVRRVEDVRAALAQLDAEWLSYEMDLEAYYLTKPVLRDGSVRQTAAYQSAVYELRGLAESLGADSSDAELAAAEHAAEAALMAWGAANDHALAVGVSDRSPTERAALRRLHSLTAQLADPATPKPMWSSLVEAISREMSKMTTVPTSWEHLTRVPALEVRNPVAIAAAR